MPQSSDRAVYACEYGSSACHRFVTEQKGLCAYGSGFYVCYRVVSERHSLVTMILRNETPFENSVHVLCRFSLVMELRRIICFLLNLVTVMDIWQPMLLEVPGVFLALPYLPH